MAQCHIIKWKGAHLQITMYCVPVRVQAVFEQGTGKMVFLYVCLTVKELI